MTADEHDDFVAELAAMFHLRAATIVDDDRPSALPVVARARIGVVAADRQPGARGGTTGDASGAVLTRPLKSVIWAAAAAVLVVGGIAVVSRDPVAPDRATAAPTADRSSARTEVPSTAAASATTSDTPTNPATATNTVSGDDTPWILPTWLPEGVQVLQMTSLPTEQRSVTPDPTRHSSSWIRRAADGLTIAARIDVWWLVRPGSRPADVAASPTNATLHGHAAAVEVKREAPYGSWANWWQPGMFVNVYSTGVPPEAFGQLLDAMVVDADAGSVTIPADVLVGFLPAARHIEPTDATATEAGETTTVIASLSPGASLRFTVTAQPTFVAGSLDDTVAAEDRRVVVGGVERSIVRVAPAVRGSAPAPPTVTWRVGGREFVLTANGAVDDDTLLRIVAGLRLVDRPAAAAAVDAGSRALHALPVIDETHTPDGLTVSAHAVDGDLAAICLAGATVRCSERDFRPLPPDTTRALEWSRIDLDGHGYVVTWWPGTFGELTDDHDVPVPAIVADRGSFVVVPAGTIVRLPSNARPPAELWSPAAQP